MLRKKNFQIIVMKYRKTSETFLLLLGFVTIYVLIGLGLGLFGIFLYQHNLQFVLILYGTASLFTLAFLLDKPIEIIMTWIVDKWE